MHWRPLAALLMTFVLSAGAVAQETRRSGDASGRLQAAVQQLTGEKAALQAENNQLKEQLAKLDKESKELQSARDDLQRRAGVAENKVSRAETSEQSTSSRLQAAEARLNEVVGKYRELAETLRKVEADGAALSAKASRDSQALKSCAQKNVDLATVANEALDHYEKKGCFTSLAQKEPFTQIKRAQIENAVQESRERIEALKVPPDDPVSR